jgi:hypothetical protein
MLICQNWPITECQGLFLSAGLYQQGTLHDWQEACVATSLYQHASLAMVKWPGGDTIVCHLRKGIGC